MQSRLLWIEISSAAAAAAAGRSYEAESGKNAVDKSADNTESKTI